MFIIGMSTDSLIYFFVRSSLLLLPLVLLGNHVTAQGCKEIGEIEIYTAAPSTTRVLWLQYVYDPGLPQPGSQPACP